MRASLIAAAVLCVLMPGQARALCTSLSVTATPVAFNVYDPASASDMASTGTVTVNCGIGLLPDLTISLSKGSGSYAQRTMTGGGHALRYNLYADAGHLTVWGDGNGGTVTQSVEQLLALGSINFTVYGLVPAGQYPAPGNYSDTIQVTVNF